ncbi:MAG: VacJ family lipoprotein [Nitrospirota bacterium]
MRVKNVFGAVCIAVVLLVPCASPAQTPAGEAIKGVETPADGLGDDLFEEEAVEEAAIADPLEPWNRLMYHFNDRLYFWVLKPVSRGYNAVVPEQARVSVRNFFDNITMPIRFVNSLLQGKPKAAGNELARFGINSTIGIAGLFDVAKMHYDINPQEEDLGQTFGAYGVGGGIYIVWPFLGPSTLRDTVGRVGDGFLNPVTYITPFESQLAVRSYDQVNRTSLQLGEYEDLKEAALEPYVAIKDAYIEYRKAQIKK